MVGTLVVHISFTMVAIAIENCGSAEFDSATGTIRPKAIRPPAKAND
jgi:hypothetical protein